MSEQLINKYRPETFDQVFGHETEIHALRAALDARNVQSFLFVGPSGVGKTTLARILATELACSERSVLEVDAATYTGIDAMRAIAEQVQYPALGETGCRMVIVDECHSLSNAAFQSLLKSIEEPSPGLYWVLCTTMGGKVPKTIQTRCLTITLKPLPASVIDELIQAVCEAESWSLPEGGSTVIAQGAEGSARQALALLSQCQGVESLDELYTILDEPSAQPEVIDFCRTVVKGSLTWQQAQAFMKAVGGQSPEGIRLMVVAYFHKVATGARSQDDFENAAQIIRCFCKPYQSKGMDELWESVSAVYIAFNA